MYQWYFSFGELTLPGFEIRCSLAARVDSQIINQTMADEEGHRSSGSLSAGLPALSGEVLQTYNGDPEGEHGAAGLVPGDGGGVVPGTAAGVPGGTGFLETAPPSVHMTLLRTLRPARAPAAAARFRLGPSGRAELPLGQESFVPPTFADIPSDEVPEMMVRRPMDNKIEDVEAVADAASLRRFSYDELNVNEGRDGRLGEGTFGEVFRGFFVSGDGREPTIVAVKRFKALDGNYDRAMSDVLVELKAAQRLGDHNNVVSCLGVCLEEGKPSLVLSYATEGSLSRFIPRLRKATVEVRIKVAAKIFMDITRGMEKMHRSGLAHLDFKSLNALVTQNGDGSYSCMVADFGLVHDVDEHSPDGSMMSGRRGTCIYMAPEMKHGWPNWEGMFDGKVADVWSMGVVFWELLSLDNQPYSSYYHQRPDQLYDDIVEGRCSLALPADNGGLPYAYGAITGLCLDRDPTKRPSTERILGFLEESA